MTCDYFSPQRESEILSFDEMINSLIFNEIEFFVFFDKIEHEKVTKIITESDFGENLILIYNKDKKFLKYLIEKIH